MEWVGGGVFKSYLLRTCATFNSMLSCVLILACSTLSKRGTRALRIVFRLATRNWLLFTSILIFFFGWFFFSLSLFHFKIIITFLLFMQTISLVHGPMRDSQDISLMSWSRWRVFHYLFFSIFIFSIFLDSFHFMALSTELASKARQQNVGRSFGVLCSHALFSLPRVN